MEHATFCPYCERRLQENALTRLVDRSRSSLRTGRGRTIAGVPERLFSLFFATFFGLLAIASAIAAMLA